MDVNNIFQDIFLTQFKEQQERKLDPTDLEIIKNKRTQLKPIQDFLDNFIKHGVYVQHRDTYNPNSKTKAEPQKFSYHFDNSSRQFSPGVSIFIEHPSIIEIGISNNQKKDGLISIHVTSINNYSYLLRHNFYTIESICTALGRFLLKCSVHVSDTEQPEEIEVNKSVLDDI